MTPTRDNGTPDDQPPQPEPTDPPTVPIPLPRRPHDARLRALRFAMRSPRSTAPASVWLCADDEVREGTGLIAAWLLTSVVRLVTTYTAPGQRVLLLAPAPGITRTTRCPTPTVGGQSSRRPYAGLMEAAWTVVRLGRGIQTQSAAERPEWFVDPVTDDALESESGPRLRPPSPSTDHPDEGHAEAQSGPDAAPTRLGLDRFDLIITAVESDALDALAPTDWASLLTPTGTLAVITHGDSAGGWLADPAGLLVRAAHHNGLRFRDRIVLLRVPAQDVGLAVPSPATPTRRQRRPGPSMPSIRHAPVHDDLFVLIRPPATSGSDDSGETSDD
jgi:hypothetical protein